jgi:hypothetical protein
MYSNTLPSACRILEEVIEVFNKDANAERLAQLQKKLAKTRARYTVPFQSYQLVKPRAYEPSVFVSPTQ